MSNVLLLLILWTGCIYIRPTTAENITLLLLLPQTSGSFKFPFGAELSGAAAYIAKDAVVKQGLLPGHNFEVEFANTKCNAVNGLGILADMLRLRNYSAIIGPQCSGVCRVVARLAAYYNIPVFSGVCQDTEMLNKQEFKTLTRFLGTFEKVGQVVKSVMDYAGWNRIGLIAERHNDRIWTLSRDAIVHVLQLENATVSIVSTYKDEPLSISLDQELEAILRNTANVSRVIVLAVRGATLRRVMELAYDIGLTNGEYAFICLYYYRQENIFGDFSWQQGDAKDDIRRQAYSTILFIEYFTPSSIDYKTFTDLVKIKSKEIFNYTYGPNDEVPYPAANLYEAVHMLATAVNETMAANEDHLDGELVSKRLWGRTLTSITRKVVLNSNGDREQGYTVLQIAPGNVFKLERVGTYYSDNGTFQPDPIRSIVWRGGNAGPPADTPPCGYNGEFCLVNLVDNQIAIIAGSLVVTLCLVIVAAGITVRIVVRRIRSEADESFWRVKYSDIVLKQKRDSTSTLSLVSRASSGENGDTIYTKVGSYKSVVVAVKLMDNMKQTEMESNIREYRQMCSLDNVNIVKVIGVCIDFPNQCIVTEYCSKGSLQDLLENSDINLDMAFKYAFMWDLLRGLIYLHSSSLKYHGNLKSSNCVVDSRFTLKLTDFGPRVWLESKERLAKDMLWTAPEVLRNREVLKPGEFQKADIYSMGVIVNEISLRQGQFPQDGTELTPDELLVRIMRPENPVCRPHIDDTMCDRKLKSFIESCWDERPILRPSLKFARQSLKDAFGSKGTNFFDNLLERMEQYANNLETVVADRTKSYLTEKRKAEDLLYRMLPRQIAEQIQIKGFVDPEYYDAVTILFTDIVGFTSISAASTPLQIIDLLNDLYSRFDETIFRHDAYKVETIGDSYMVVSGLPSRNEQHCFIIADLAQDLMRDVLNTQIRHKPDEKLSIRIGIHSGSCVAGIVGLTMPRYCLFGDTVNVASRMESHGQRESTGKMERKCWMLNVLYIVQPLCGSNQDTSILSQEESPFAGRNPPSPTRYGQL